MKRLRALYAICVFTLPVIFLNRPVLAQTATTQATAGGVLKGTVTDPSGASVPGAVITVRAGSNTLRGKTDDNGQYSLGPIKSGNYSVRVLAKGFVPYEEQLELTGAATKDISLLIASEAQVLTVEEEINQVNTDPSSNGGAIVLREQELQALSDDPDELSQQLQAMAGPSAGPNGGQIYIDGFTGGNLPPKSSIREVRINSNPFSSEYDRPGFGRIEILTKPGSDKLRGQAFFQFNNQALNSRSPLLTTSLPDYQQRFFGFNLGGPIRKGKASYGFDFENRKIDENAFVLATTIDPNTFQLQSINQAIVTPQTRTNFSPRLDYQINSNNTLIARYQFTRASADNEGVGNFALASQAYSQRNTENTFQLTETAVLGPHTINETRFQFSRSDLSNIVPAAQAGVTPYALNVQGAFLNGSPTIGNSGTVINRWEVTNATTYNIGAHTWKIGARVRQSFLEDTSRNNFNGTYTFLGGLGPELDANNQIIAGTSVTLTALERYRRTLLFQSLGYDLAAIRNFGGGASQFTLAGGTPTSSISQTDLGVWINDDWRARPNLTFSYGLRYETQTNIHDWSDLAPRFAVAWAIGQKNGTPAKMVLRAGAGVFYDRLADTLSLAELRFNGLTQQSYFLRDPGFFGTVPSTDALNSSPQTLQFVDTSVKAPRTYQANFGVERQLTKYVKLTGMFIESRGVHLQRAVNINAPLNGAFPYGNSQVRYLTETTGFSRSHQLVFSPNVNYKKLFLFGFYSLSYGKTDAEGFPADPYNLRAEWGPSSFADVRHRFVVGTNLPVPYLKVNLSPFIFASSGSPYNITTGRDVNGDSLTTERPALLNLGAAACTGTNLIYESGYGCFNLTPTPGTAISRNSGRGPGTFNFNLRVTRTWGFGSRGEVAGPGGPEMVMRGPGGGGPPPGGGPGGGGGGMRGGGGPGGGGPGGFFGGGNTAKKYNVTLALNIRNLLNHPNYGAPSGDLSSPFFGEYRSLAGFGPFGGNSTYNRKIDIQLRFSF